MKGFEKETVKSTARLMDLDPEALESVAERLIEANSGGEFDGESVDTIVSGVEEMIGE
ncbi:hypothetical protein [Halobaculum gomorrense]|uniref:hypothetical protein n=1 Tax=Halobaculum gomorrense TaxID=43928 RepID=UPI0013563126|nr:hypothetical protein [Halobaculum gomorrense]